MNGQFAVARGDGHIAGHAIEEGILYGIAAGQAKQCQDRKDVWLHRLIPMRSLMAAMPLVFVGSAMT